MMLRSLGSIRLPTTVLGWTGLACAVAMAGIGTATVFTSLEANRMYSASRSALADDPTRLAVRVDHDFAALQASVAESALPGSGVDPTDASVWLDLLHQHADALRVSGLSDRHRSVSALPADLDRAVAAARPLVDGVRDPRQALSMLGSLRRIDHKVSAAAMAADSENSADMARWQRDLMAVQSWMDWLLASMMACSLVLVSVMGWSHRCLRLSARRQRGLTASLDAALANMAQGLAMISADGEVTVSNPLLAVMAGRDGLPARLAADADWSAHGFGPALSAAAVGCSAVVTVGDGRSVSVISSAMVEGGFVVTFDDVTERMRASAKLEHVAHTDTLTGLANRDRHEENLSTSLANAATRGTRVALLAVDLDGFKDVNDTYGHPVGDAVLREVACRLKDASGDGTLVARMGGDEFTLVRELAPGEDPAALARDVIEAVSRPILTVFGEVAVGASVGIAVSPGDGTHAPLLAKGANVALYEAKKAGKGFACRYDASIDTERRDQRSLAQELRLAVPDGQLVLHFQPIVDAETGRIKLYEALVRWEHPQRGLVPPGRFIPLAEDTGDIVAIGEWVLHAACHAAASWEGDVGVAVNLSPKQFASPDLVDVVANALAASGLSAARLEVEVTEGVLIKDTVETLRILEALKALGVRIALDDFGTGYASLSYLHRFPFDKIKIDQSFVRDMGDDDNSSRIVAMMTDLAEQLGLMTCAEGVETLEQAKRLIAMGCRQLQGYFYGRPEADAVAHLATEEEAAAA